MKITHANVLDAYQLFARFSKIETTNFKFKYFVMRNLQKLKTEYETVISVLNTPCPEYDAVDKKRMNLIEKYAEKNEDGSIKTNDKREAIFTEEERDKFTEEMKLLQEEWDKAKTIYNSHIKKIEEFTKEEIDFEPYTLSMENMEGIPSTAEDLETLEGFLIEEKN